MSACTSSRISRAGPEAGRSDRARPVSPGGPGPALAAVLAAALLGGCAGPKVTVATSPQLEQYAINTVVVLPFGTVLTPQVARPTSPELTRPSGVVKSDISPWMPRATQGLAQATTVVPPAAGMKVARLFTGKLRGRPGLAVIPPREAGEAVQALDAQQPDLGPEERARRLAQTLKADGVVVGVVRIYKEREGSKYGAEPAVVGFEVKLVASDGRVLWTGNYYEEQRPITEDFMGFVNRGFGFLTAEELATYGAAQLAERFPFGA